MYIQHDSWIKFLVNSLIKDSKNGHHYHSFQKDIMFGFTLFRNAVFKTEEKTNKLFKEQLLSGKLEIVFKTTQRMSSCFRFKDAIPCSLLSGVTYEYKCPRCNSRYIGSTYRYWEKRLEEQLPMSALMGKPFKGLVICSYASCKRQMLY